MNPEVEEDCEDDYQSKETSSPTAWSSSVVIRRAHSLVPFSKLRPNADLNCPPSNWLRSDNLATFSHQTASTNVNSEENWTTGDGTETGHIEPSSVVLASHHPKAVGHVDVVADSKNIKKLLKLPYSNSAVSLAVHRVGNRTLLIDDFNAPLLLNRGESANLEKVLQDSPAPFSVQHLLPRKKDPENTHHRNMMSKFLYHSSQKDSGKALVEVQNRVTAASVDSKSDPNTGPTKTNTLAVNETEWLGSGNPEEDLVSVKTGKQDSRNQSMTGCASICSSGVLTLPDNQSTNNFQVRISNSEISQTLIEPNTQDDTKKIGSDIHAHLLSDKASKDLQLMSADPSTTVPMVNAPITLPTMMQASTISPRHQDQPVPHSSMREDNESRLPCDRTDSTEVSGRRIKNTFPNQPSHLSPQPFHLNVQWTVSDIRMLLGSDLPIFGVDGHPAISLKLRDMQKPITVLTGMDYWLDNLMCNVPELAMCFHVDGIVQDYHVIKTEDIPRLDESCQFSPDEVLDVVRNILGFLKANCTREGHTYWLFRQKGEDVVKLYDLTSLYTFQGDLQESHNPFAKSVAVLFYRVAHNMLNGGEELTSEDLAVTKLLLENCIKLMGRKNKEITLSAYYLLADLFLNKVYLSPTPSDNGHPTSSDNNPLRQQTEHSNNSTILPTGTTLKSVSVSLLCEGGFGFPVDQEHPLPSLVVGSSLDRARLALEQVSEALLAVDIPSLVTAGGTPPPWKIQGACKLLYQAGSAYLLLADVSLGQNKLGRALRYGKYSVLCSSSGTKLLCRAETLSIGESVLCNAWQVCGDIHCLSTKLSDSFLANLEDFQLENPEDTSLINVAQCVHKYCGGMDEKEMACLSLHTELETSLLKSIDCYQLAHSNAHTNVPHILEERLGNAWNELGVYYLQLASNLDFNKDPKNVEKLWKSSYSCISDGLAQFKMTSNVVNQALLSANLGRLMRSCAHAYGLQRPKEIEVCAKQEKMWEYSQQEKLYYSKSVEYYLDAKLVLRRQSAHPGIWTNVVLDLSRVYLTIGTIMLRHSPLSYLTQQEISQEVSDVLNKALCNVEPALTNMDSTHPSYTEFCKVAGDCHARLGELHHQSSLSSSLNSQKLKQLKTLTEKQYAKALIIYKVECHYCEVLELLLDKSYYFEKHAQGKTRLKGIQSALSSLLQAVGPLKIISKQSLQTSPLVHSLFKRLVEVVKQLLIAAKKSCSENAALVQVYKRMYGEMLQRSKQVESGTHTTTHLMELLSRMIEFNTDLQT
ncbi:erythroid differentiation-related factor 1-like isoform X3 [Halichondria panicea]|uniref:erythroid differentiation-related factor 1-like isoform X3 n=1 Tax=Halichondria panicea TaxID=6063 RepID=UPI00312B3AEB